jgi:hypothetical protein
MPFLDKQKRKAYHREYYRAWRRKNRAKSNEASRAWKLRNPEKTKEYQRREGQKERRKKWRSANPDRVREYDRKSYQKHREVRIKADMKYRRDNPEKTAEYKARAKTKAIAAASTRRYVAKKKKYVECTDYPPRPTDSKCSICHREAQLCLDHDHVTGKFRGYICRDCNMALGKLGDTVEAIRRVLAYLEQSDV